MKKWVILLLTISMLAGSLGLPAGAEEGFFHSQLVFQTGGASNYRIPTMITTNSGAVFAFCNDRQQSVSDFAEIQWLSYSVAKDGVNFSDSEYLLKKDGWTYVIGSAVYDAVNNNIILVYYSTIVTDAAKAEYNAMTTEERAFHLVGSCIVESRDEGKTWTRRQVTFPKSMTFQNATPSIHGSSAGIQLKSGEHAGRLVFPGKVKKTAGDGTSVGLTINEKTSCLIYSDDFGYTWRASLNSMPLGSDETAICELPDGSILISARMFSNLNCRAIAYSRDGGRTIVEKRIDDTLEVQCQFGIKGSVINIPDYNGKGNSLTLFSSLNSPSCQRKNLCVWISYDEGQTWPEMATLDAGLASYSEMQYNPVTDLVNVIWECGKQSCFSDGIRIAAFDVDWLLSQKRPNVFLRNTQPLPEGIEAEVVEESLVWKLSDHADEYANNVNVKGLNGKDTLEFTGNSGIVVSEGVKEVTGNVSYFVVFRYDKKTPNNEILLRSGHAQGIKTFMSSTSTSVTTQLGSSVYNCAEAVEFSDREWHILAITWSGDSKDTAIYSQFQDGHTSIKYELGAYALRTSTAAGNLGIGSTFVGEIAEVLVYNRCLSDGEVAATGLALAETYGLEWKLAEEEEDPVPPTTSGTADSNVGSEPQQAPATNAPTAQAPAEEGCGSAMAPRSLLAMILGVACGLLPVRRKKKTIMGGSV